MVKKVKRVVLLGAGSSVPADVPAAYDMTELIVANLRKVPRDDLAIALSAIVASLVLELTLSGGNPFGKVNVEDVFNAVDLVASRNLIEIATFISDHRTIRLVDHLQQLQPYLQNDICDELKKRLRRELIRLTWLTDHTSVKYLGFLTELATRQPGLCIATLNYDNTIELLASNNEIACELGIDGWFSRGDFALAPTGINLLKLHGSINWTWTTGKPLASNPIPAKTLRYATSDELAEMRYDPAVIFGHRNKLSADGPFLDLWITFRRELVTADELIVVGYSFGDSHINGYLAQWLSTNEHKTMRVVDPYISDTAEIIRRFWKSDPLFTPPAWKAFNIGLPDYGKAYENRIIVIKKSIADATELLDS